MTDCKHCEHAFCEYAGMERGFKVKCANYVPPKKPQTNADRIRAMSDEELASWLDDGGWVCKDCPECEPPLLRGEVCDGACKRHFLDWLRQPVKDGDNDGE